MIQFALRWALAENNFCQAPKRVVISKTTFVLPNTKPDRGFCEQPRFKYYYLVLTCNWLKVLFFIKLHDFFVKHELNFTFSCSFTTTTLYRKPPYLFITKYIEKIFYLLELLAKISSEIKTLKKLISFYELWFHLFILLFFSFLWYLLIWTC